MRIAVHPDMARMGYGSHACEQLERYYLRQLTTLSEKAPIKSKKVRLVFEIELSVSEIDPSILQSKHVDDADDLRTERLTPREATGTLLERLSEREPETLHWIGTSFGLTQDLYQFWNRCGYKPVYLRQTAVRLCSSGSWLVLTWLSSLE